jgi:hypothetical protein
MHIRKWNEVKKLAEENNLKLLSRCGDKYLLQTKEGYKIIRTPHQLRIKNISQFVGTVNPFSIDNIKIYLYITQGLQRYSLLSEVYERANKNLEWVCDKGHIFKMSWNNLSSGQRCPICNLDINRNIKYTYEEISELAMSNGYKILSKDYISALSNIDIEDDDGYRYSLSLTSIKSNNINFRFANKNPFTIYNINLWLSKYNDDLIKYKLISTKFESVAKDKLLWKCPIHGEFKMTWNNFYKHNARCAKCNQSKGENKIEKYLKSMNLKYKSQYIIDELKYKASLRFDFAVFNNGKIVLIEYNGMQHYKSINYFGGDESFKIQKFKDKLKNEYCKFNDIKLLVIPYWDYNNIDNILDDFAT